MWTLESLGHGTEQPGLEVEYEFVGEPVHIQVGLHLGLGVDERGVAALPRLESSDLVGDLAVDELHPVVAKHGKAASKRKIDESNGLGQRLVFGVHVAVVLGDLFASDVTKLRALLAEIVVK